MLSFSLDTAGARRRLGDAARRQVPYATMLAVNDLAFQVQRAEAAAMTEVFAHPRPFTAKSVQVDRATKGSLSATVFVRPEVAKYLKPYETGGLHVLPGKALLKPVDIRLDAYGQLPKSTMALLAARKDIYIGPVKTRTGIVTGVWQRLAITRSGGGRRHRLAGGGVYDAAQGALKLLIRLGNAIEVTKRLGFHKRAGLIIAANATKAFQRAFAKALASAR